jgi:NAD(P)H-dependent flavin oxidoreductase YrpB (nitropropane dioxygenase family)
MSPNGLCRAMKNAITNQVDEIQKEGGSLDEIERVAYRGQIRKALIDGDLENGLVCFGIVAGSIKELMGAGEVVQRLVKQYDEASLEL